MPDRKNLIRIAGLCLALGATAAHAQVPGAATAPLLRAGQWQVHSGTVGQPTVAYNLCFKTGALEDLKLLLPQLRGHPACRAPEIRIEGGQLQWNLTCPAPGPTVSARYRLQAEQVEGSVDMVSGQPPQARTGSISARYIGACPAP